MYKLVFYLTMNEPNDKKVEPKKSLVGQID